MEMFGKIRRMYFRDKLSLHEITKRSGLSRNTIRKWLRDAKETAPPTYRRREELGKLTAFHELLELPYLWTDGLFLLILLHGGWFLWFVSDFDNQILHRNLHHLNPSC